MIHKKNNNRKGKALIYDSSKPDSSIRFYFKYFDRHKESDKIEKKKIHEPFVTISREVGVNGLMFGEMLIKYLTKNDLEAKSHWTLFERNLMEKVAEEHNLPADIAKYMPERKISELQDILEKFFGIRPRSQNLIYKTSSTILHLAHLGNVVLVGRGGNIITKDIKGGIHIRLIASKEYRIKNIQDFYKMSKLKAQYFMEDEDKVRKDYIKKTFRKNVEDPKLYSIVFNMDYINHDDAVNMIGEQIIKMRKSINK